MTPAKPERMTDAEFARLERQPIPTHSDYARIAFLERQSLRWYEEAARARAEEERLSRQVECMWDLADVLALAYGHAIGRWLGYREAAIRLRERLGDYLREETKASTALDAIGLILGTDRWDDAVEEMDAVKRTRDAAVAARLTAERDSARVEVASLVEAVTERTMERDAAREEVDRLRHALRRISKAPGPWIHAARKLAYETLTGGNTHE